MSDSGFLPCVGCGEAVDTTSDVPHLAFGAFDGDRWRLFAAYHGIDCFHLAHPENAFRANALHSEIQR